MTDRSGTNDTHSRAAERRHSRRTFISHAAPAAAAAAAAVGIAVAVDPNNPEQTRLTILPGAGLVYDVRAYGARGDGQTDDAAAIQSAIHAAAHFGGTVYFPAGTYAVGKTLVCGQNSKAFTLCGAGGGQSANTTPSVLLYTGTKTGPSGGLLTFNSSFGFEVCHLAFNYSNTAFRGDLITIDGEPHHADTQDFHIHHCSSKAIGAQLSARSIIRLNKAIIGTISCCQWTGTLGNGIRIGDPGGSYVVAVQVEKCTFNDNLDGHILLGTSDGESIVIRDCSFEAGSATKAAIRGTTQARDGGDNALYSPVIECCWFGDAALPVTWIDSLFVASNAYTGTIRGGRFAATTGTHLKLKGRWLVEANSFDNGTVFATTGPDLLDLVAIANFYNTSKLFDPVDFPLGSPTAYVSLGNVGAADVLAGDVGVKGTSGALSDSIANLLLGALVNPGYEPGGAASKVYHGKSPSSTVPMLALQAPSQSNAGDLVLLAGARPTPVVHVQDQKLGFFDTLPANQPKAEGTTSGFASGKGHAVDSAATFTGGIGSSAYTISDIVKALKQLGVIAS